VALADLQDNDRRLPLETGVIDLAGFIGALRKIGSEGPVVAEPFSSRLKSLESDEARLQETGESLRKLLA
jgi:sugar phosphate isomerase/epimerase